MRRLVIAATVLVLLSPLGACSSGSTAQVEREGERCQDLNLEPGRDGRVQVGSASFVPLSGFSPAICTDDSEWVSVTFDSRHPGEEHKFATVFGVMDLDTDTAALVTPENRMDMLSALANECVAADRADPRCYDFSAAPNNFAIPGIDCVGWEETWLDVGVSEAEGQEWPMRAWLAVCFEPGTPPASLVLMSWSESHSPDIEAIALAEAEQQAREFMGTLRFDVD